MCHFSICSRALSTFWRNCSQLQIVVSHTSWRDFPTWYCGDANAGARVTACASHFCYHWSKIYHLAKRSWAGFGSGPLKSFGFWRQTAYLPYLGCPNWHYSTEVRISSLVQPRSSPLDSRRQENSHLDTPWSRLAPASLKLPLCWLTPPFFSPPVQSSAFSPIFTLHRSITGQLSLHRQFRRVRQLWWLDLS